MRKTVYSIGLKIIGLLLLLVCAPNWAESCRLEYLDENFPRLHVPPDDPIAEAQAKIQRYLEHAQMLRNLASEHLETGWLSHLYEVIDIHEEAAAAIAYQEFGKTPMLVGMPPELRLLDPDQWTALKPYMRSDQR